MALTKAALSMLDPGPNTDPGDFVQQNNDGQLELQTPGSPPGEQLPGINMEFDRDSGTLTLTVGDAIVQARGLPTEQTLPSGPIGPRGREGKAGTQGRNGRDGAPGIQGCQGPKGDRGPKGATGATGERGIQGPVGDLGPTGPIGPTGPAGIDGEEPEYFPGIRNSLGSHTFVDIDDEGNTIQGESPFIRMVRSGAMLEWGRYVSDTGTEDVTVLFSQAFVNRVTGVFIFWTNPNSYQAQNYELGEFIEIDSDIGGFTIGVSGSPTLPLTDTWDFQWLALGD
jgi:hypothetical protein